MTSAEGTISSKILLLNHMVPTWNQLATYLYMIFIDV